MNNNAALCGFLWPPNQTHNLDEAMKTWNEFGEPGNGGITEAQVSQWGGAWRSYPNERNMLLEVLRQHIEKYPQDKWDYYKSFWYVLIMTPHTDPGIEEQRKSFMDMVVSASKDPLWFDIKTLMIGSIGSEEQLGVVRMCFEYVQKHGTYDHVQKLFETTQDWLMTTLTQANNWTATEENAKLWNEVLDVLKPGYFSDQITQMMSMLRWISSNRNVFRDQSLSGAEMIIQGLVNKGVDPTHGFVRLLELEKGEGGPLKKRMYGMMEICLRLGADWEARPNEDISETAQNWLMNHPGGKKKRLEQLVGDKLSQDYARKRPSF